MPCGVVLDARWDIRRGHAELPNKGIIHHGNLRCLLSSGTIMLFDMPVFEGRMLNLRGYGNHRIYISRVDSAVV